MQNNIEHETNHFHSLILELQEAKRLGHIFQIQFLSHDLLVLMNSDTTTAKITEVADYISKKYRIYTEASISAKTITIFDVYMLDPKV
jgi:hypothetical protein